MTTDRTIDAWKSLLEYSIGSESSPLTGVPVQLRDSEQVKTYPGIYLAESGEDRVGAGGVQDSNVFRIVVDTMLVTTPGDDDDEAASQGAHSLMRDTLAGYVANPLAQGWINSEGGGITCFDLLASSPKTTNEDDKRVTTWQVTFTVC